MTDFIYIADFTVDDRHLLLEYLWGNTIDIIEPGYEFNIETAKMQLAYNGGYAHIICGRKIEVYLYDVYAVDSYMYDFHNGIGMVQELVTCIRDLKKEESQMDVQNIGDVFNDIKL